jgi:hypothetical protein
MSTKGKISVTVTANAVKFNRTMKDVRKDLKTTGASIKAFGGQIAAVSKGIAGFALAGAAFAAGGAVIVKSSLSAIKELKTLSTAAGLTVAELQRGAFAARQAGIEQDKYADILKDVNDKVGDFLVTGAGPMVDFFEKIAPKVGITADAFKGLNSQEALGLYVKSLEEANVNQQEMTFFMEAIASDSTLLLPLLTENGKAMKEYAAQAEALGIGLSEIDVAKAIEAEEKLATLGTVISGKVNVAVVELSDFIVVATDEMINFVAESGGIRAVILPALRSLVVAFGYVADVFNGLKVRFQIVKVLALGFIALVTTAFEGFFTGAVTGLNAFTSQFAKEFRIIGDLIRPLSDEAANMFDGMAKSIGSAQLKVPKLIQDIGASQREALAGAAVELSEMALAATPLQRYTAAFDAIVAKSDEATAKMKANIEDERIAREKAGDVTSKPEEVDLSDFDINDFRKNTDLMIASFEGRYHLIEEKDLEHVKKMQDQLVAAKDAGLVTTQQFNKTFEDLSKPRKLANFDFDAFREETATIISSVNGRYDLLTEAQLIKLREQQELLAAAKTQELVTDDQATTAGSELDTAIEGSDLIKYQEESIGLIGAMGLRLQSQEEMQIAADARELAQLNTQLENKKISVADYEEKTAEIERRSNEAKRQNTKKNLEIGFQLLAQNSSKVGKLMESIAIYQAVIKGKQAAVDAWQAGMSTGGLFAPVVAAAYAAASIARTGAMINSIKSGAKSAGGGGSTPSTPAGGSGGNTGGGQMQAQQPSRVFNVDFAGGSSTSTEQTRNLLELINEQAGDNVEINLRGA